MIREADTNGDGEIGMLFHLFVLFAPRILFLQIGVLTRFIFQRL